MMPEKSPDIEDATASEPAWLADLMVSSTDGEPLRLDPDGAHSPTAGLLAPRAGGLLRFVDSDSYADSFGKEWNWFDETQLDRPGENRNESRQSFAEKTGFTAVELEGRRVLDVGCGMGRFAEVASSYGAEVLGVDLSVAAEAAQRNLGERANTAFIQADVFNLPLRPESFDFIYSIGVLHHTPNTRAAFSQLPGLLKPGGRIAIWVYSNERRLRYLASDLLRPITTRMDDDRLLQLCKAAGPLGALYRTRLGRPLSAILPVSRHPDPEWRVLDTFDWYAPKFQWKHDYPEVEAWFREAGLTDIRRHEVAVSVSGRRP